ncbi:non-ribosomal peptide synthetase [Granulicella mallensis]|uniref:Amino acid adenylation domain protein n=1 Tax=Granulicella mallensis (strain ATCC BAA-1857 / DSM 23137 / MP5ACTX8) TaxID=682795 RepID=G8NU11_GRAMM|nr:non-ribosomal peptide synthetase [Granulicella mallensis]AEU37567.1 amino acid adenylation domain protein [Granulicella mallensis MP5ACTX8]
MKKTLDTEREELLKLLREKRARQAGGQGGLIPLPRESALLLSEVQERLWTQQAMGDGVRWAMGGALELTGPLNVEALRAALNALVERHEPLRTRFVPGENGRPQQMIDEPTEADFQVQKAARSQVEALVRVHEEQVFDLERGSLFRVLLVEISAEEHVLSLAMHHIVADGWSVDVLVRDMRELYRAKVEGDAPKLTPLGIQYADWAVWQRGLDLSGSIGYWKKVLATPPAPLVLAGAPAPKERGDAQQVVRAMPRKLAEALTGYARDRRASLFMVLTAGWALVSYRRTRVADLLLGTTVAGRERLELEPLIGFFINIVALRLHLDGDPNGHELVDRVRRTILDGFEHQSVPFERLLAEVEGLRQSDGGSPVPIMLRHQNYRQADVRYWAGNLEALVFEGNRIRQATSDLDLQYFGEEVELTVAAEFDSARFDAAEVGALLDELEIVLGRLVAEPSSRLSQLIELTSEERVAQESALLGAERVWETGSIIGLFGEQVRLRPEAVACRDGKLSLTYGELDRRSGRVAQVLVARGVNAGERVALYLPRGVDLVAALLGIWKAGGVYVPVDPGYPDSYAARILADVEPRAIVVEREQSHGFDLDDAKLITLDALWDEQEEEPWQQGPEPDLEDLAYIAYTSGSTGKPKGVQVEHGQLLNCLRNLWETLPFAPGERVAQKTATGFVVHLKEMFSGLLAGVPQWIASDLLVRDTPTFARALAEQEVTRLNLVPSQLNALLAYPEHLHSLRYVVTAGEPLPEALRTRFAQLLPEAHLYNNYGTTETNDLTYFHAAGPGISSETRGSGSVAMGIPIANTRLHLLGEDGQPVPPGVVGELCVEGVPIGKHGYWRQPELTAERQVSNPFNGDGTTLFRTGDMARLGRGPVRQLEYIGRVDFQVKLRGQKVDPLGVEQVLGQHPKLARVAVQGWNSGMPDALLAAYYVPRLGEASPDRNQLHRWLTGRLPAHMVPAVYVPMEAMPLLPNGKLNRFALPRPEPAVAPVPGHHPPEGVREQTLAKLWASVLQLPIEQISREDNFFAIGGNSLLAVQLLECMRNEGLKVDGQLLFNQTTLKALAETTEEKDFFEVPPNLIPQSCKTITPEMLTLVTLSAAEIESIAERIPGGSSNIQDIYPLAPLQEGLLFQHIANTKGDPYLLSNMLAVKSREDALALLDALQSVVNRHDILRTAVLWQGLREPVQVVLRKVAIPIEEIEVPSTAIDIDDYLRARFDARHYRIDLDKAPLLRACLAEDQVHGRWIVLLLFHHIIMDRVSLELVQQEVGAHLYGEAESLPAALPYRNFVAQARLGADQTQQESFFRAMLGDFDEPTAPFGISGVESESMHEASRPLDAKLAARLREHARALSVSVAVIFHLAWAYVLAETAGREDVVFGTVLSGRMHAGAGADRVLGLFINTLPIRIHIGEESAQDQIRQLSDTLAALLSYEQTPLALAQRCSNVPAPRPLFLSILNYRHYRKLRMDEPIEPFSIESLAAHDGGDSPVTLAVDDTESGFVLRACVVPSLDAERIWTYMNSVLEQIAEALDEENSEQHA